MLPLLLGSAFRSQRSYQKLGQNLQMPLSFTNLSSMSILLNLIGPQLRVQTLNPRFTGTVLFDIESTVSSGSDTDVLRAIPVTEIVF